MREPFIYLRQISKPLRAVPLCNDVAPLVFARVDQTTAPPFPSWYAPQSHTAGVEPEFDLYGMTSARHVVDTTRCPVPHSMVLPGAGMMTPPRGAITVVILIHRSWPEGEEVTTQ